MLQLVTEKLKSTYKQLKEITSAEMNFQRYRHEIQAIHQTPCVPRLSKNLPYSSSEPLHCTMFLVVSVYTFVLVPLVVVYC